MLTFWPILIEHDKKEMGPLDRFVLKGHLMVVEEDIFAPSRRRGRLALRTTGETPSCVHTYTKNLLHIEIVTNCIVVHLKLILNALYVDMQI